MVGLRVTLANEPLFQKDTGLNICSKGWNCPYVINFIAPGYKCEQLACGVSFKVRKLGAATPPFNTTVFAPMGNLTYYAKNDIGEYQSYQIASNPGGCPSKSLRT